MTAVANLSANLALNSAQFNSGMQTSDRIMNRSAANMNKKLIGVEKTAQKSFRRSAQAVAAFQGPLGGVAGRLSTLGALIGTSGIAMTAFALAVTGGVVALGKAVSISEEFERSQLRVAAVLKATGYSSGQTAEGIRKFSEVLARDTLASVQGVEEAASILLTFRKVAGDTFTRTLKLAQDLASAGFGNLKTNTLQLGKALQDPLTGLTALTRSGVTFTQTQKDMIKSLVKAGDAAQAQTIILDELAQQVGGVGKQEGAGLTGSFDSLSQSVDDTFLALEKLTGAKSAVNSFIQALDRGLQVVNNQLNPGFGQRLFDENEKLQELYDDRIKIIEESENSTFGINSFTSQKNIENIDEKIKQQEKLLKNLIREEAAQERKRQAAKKASEAAQLLAEQEQKSAEQKKANQKLLKEEAKELERYQEKVDGVVSQMEFEVSQRGKTTEQIEVMNALRRAEIDQTEILITKNGHLVGTYSEQAAVIAKLARNTLDRKQAEQDLDDALKEEENSHRRGEQVTLQHQSAEEKYAETLKELTDLYEKGAITAETYARGQEQAIKDLDSSTLRLGETFEGVFDSLVDDLSRGELSWKSFASVAISALIEIGKNAVQTQGGLGGILGGLFGGGGGGSGGGSFGSGGGIFDVVLSLGSSFAPKFFADGGRPPVGQWAVVGEEGPELWKADTAGTIIPNSQLGGVGGGNTLYADLRGASVEAVQRLEQWANDMDMNFEEKSIDAISNAKNRGYF